MVNRWILISLILGVTITMLAPGVLGLRSEVMELRRQIANCPTCQGEDTNVSLAWQDGNRTGSALGKVWAIEWAVGQGAARWENPDGNDGEGSGSVLWSHEFLPAATRAKYHALGWEDMEPSTPEQMPSEAEEYCPLCEGTGEKQTAEETPSQ